MAANATSAALTPSRLKVCCAMPQAPDQQAQTDDAVENDHHGGEYRVARQRGRFGAARNHQGDDQRHFDQRDRQGQHQRAIGFADAMRDHFGVMHGGEYAAGEGQSDDPHKNSAGANAKTRHPQHNSCNDGRENGPQRQVRPASARGEVRVFEFIGFGYSLCVEAQGRGSLITSRSK